MLPPWSTACCLWFALLAHVLLILCGARLAALFVMLSAADSEVEFKSKEVNAEALQETAHAKAARNQLEKTLRYGAAFGVLCTSIKMGKPIRRRVAPFAVSSSSLLSLSNDASRCVVLRY